MSSQFTMATCFSGIGAPEVGAEDKFAPVWCAEIEPFPAAVLAARFGASAPRFMPSPDEPDLDDEDRKSRRAALKAVAEIVGGNKIVNLGDVTNPAFLDDALKLGNIDLLVGGPPCQAFSVAGLRNSLEDDRGNLSLRFVEIAHAIRPRILLVENVPGWLSTDDNAFGCFLGAIVGGDTPLSNPLDGKWPDSGMVAGPRSRVAWRVFDAQYFRVAQRRRRVFAVVSFGDDDPARILFEPKRLSGNIKPSRETREVSSVAGTLGARTSGGSGLGTDFELAGGNQPIAARMTAFGEYEIDETASTVKARDWKDATDLVINLAPDIPGTLKGEGFDSTEDGSGRTTLIPQVLTYQNKDVGLVPSDLAATLKAQGTSTDERSVGAYVLEQRETVGTICADSFSGGAGGRPEGAVAGHFQPVAYAIQERAGAENLSSGPGGKGFTEEVAYTLEARRPQSVALAFTSKDDGSDATEEMSPTLRGMNNANSRANGGGQVAVAFDLRGREGGVQFEGPHDTANIRAASGGSSRSYVLDNNLRLAVRRLTPTECEALQGFPAGFTAIEGIRFRKVSADMAAYISAKGSRVEPFNDGTQRTRLVADGPRYKSLWNSWAVPCGHWIINRIYLEMKGELK